ncbi:MAG: pol polyprotein, partial [Desulfobacterales bacterium]
MGHESLLASDTVLSHQVKLDGSALKCENTAGPSGFANECENTEIVLNSMDKIKNTDVSDNQNLNIDQISVTGNEISLVAKTSVDSKVDATSANQSDCVLHCECGTAMKIKKRKKSGDKRCFLTLLKEFLNSGAFDSVSIEIVEVRRVNFSKSSTIIPIQIKNQKINAVMDSGAQKTILSEQIFDKLEQKPPVLGPVKLRMADGSTLVNGMRVGPVSMKIGEKFYKFDVIVAPLAEDMLFGHDIIQSQPECTMDFIRGVLYFDDQRILTASDEGDSGYAISNVTVTKRIKVPAGSIRRIVCKMDKQLDDYIIETFSHLKVIAPKILRKGGTDPVICLMNPRERPVVIKKGQMIGRAFPVESISEDSSDPNKEFDSLRVRVEEDYYNIRNLTSSEEGGEPVENSEIENLDVPDHLTKTFWASAKMLSTAERVELSNLLKDYGDVFASSDYDLGNFTAIEHKIDTGDAKPIKLRMRRTPLGFAEEEKALLDKMLKAGVIQESTSDWAAAPVLIRKRDGSVRWCIDYRALNDVTVKDVFPLPLVSECIDTLSGNVWFSKLDANSAYWQVRINEEDRKKTAFLTKYGLYEHVRMGFGLCNAPATFSRVMNLVLRGLHWKTVLAFLDDILVLGKSFDDHVQNLSEVFEKLRSHGLKLKPKKCELFQKEVEFLGRLISENGIRMSPKDIDKVLEWPIPKSYKDVQRFLGLANYHRDFISHFSEIADPLYRVSVKDKFEWYCEQQEAFDKLKVALTTPPVLTLPNADDTFILDTDASGTAIGAQLSQIQNGVERVIAYGSFALSKEQRKYCVTRRELLAVVRFTRHYRHYLLGKPFIIRTDHSSLKWLMNFREPQGQMARWLDEISSYPISQIEHRMGKNHVNADALSRIDPDQISHWSIEDYYVSPSELPCEGCKGCMKMHSDWAEFVDVVDDVIPLSSTNQSDMYHKEVNDYGVNRVFNCLVNGCSGYANDIHEMKLAASVPPVTVSTEERAKVKDTETPGGSGWSAESVFEGKLKHDKSCVDPAISLHTGLMNEGSFLINDVEKTKSIASSPSVVVESNSDSQCERGVLNEYSVCTDKNGKNCAPISKSNGSRKSNSPYSMA